MDKADLIAVVARVRRAMPRNLKESAKLLIEDELQEFGDRP